MVPLLRQSYATRGKPASVRLPLIRGRIQGRIQWSCSLSNSAVGGRGGGRAWRWAGMGAYGLRLGPRGSTRCDISGADVGTALCGPGAGSPVCAPIPRRRAALAASEAILRAGPRGERPGWAARARSRPLRHGRATPGRRCPPVLTGVVIGQCLPRHRHDEFLTFLRRVDREVPKGLAIHMILDNYATHKHADVTAWLAKHPRFHPARPPGR